MKTIWHDIRYGLRQLRKSPGFTAVAVLTLAIGIGANMAIFSFVRTVLLDPLPAHNSERLVQIRALDKRSGKYCMGLNPPTISELYKHDEIFSELVVTENHSLVYQDQDELNRERAWGHEVTTNFFNVWDIVPDLGRTFVTDEGKPGKSKVMVLSHKYWKGRFGGRADIIGETIHFDGMDATIVGVMPPHFRFPYSGLKYWIPEDAPDYPDRGYQFRGWGVVARLQPGVTLTQTQALLDAIAARHAQEHPEHNEGFGTTVRPLRMVFTTEAVQKTLLSLMGVVGFILLIACANLANLLFARTENRKRELAIRSGLGAGKFRLIRQLLTENIILAIIGGLFGLLVTYWSIKALTMIIPENMPQLKPVRIDFGLFGITLMFSVAVGVAFGLAPAWIACRGKISDSLKQAVSAVSPDRVRKRLSDALVVLEVALAVVLLSGAGLMISSVIRLLQVDPGYDPTNLVRAHMALPWKYQDLEMKGHFLRQLHERWSSLPGVEAVGIGVAYFGQNPEDWISSDGTIVKVKKVGCGIGTEDFLKTIGARLIAGRYLEQSDIGANQKTIVVNKMMSQRFRLGDNPVGQTITHDSGKGPVRYEVVGVINDSRDQGLNQEIEPLYFRPYQEMPVSSPHFMAIRTTVKPSSILTSLRKELKVLEPTMDSPIFVMIEDSLYNSTASHRIYMKCLVLAAAVALSLSVLGIYGVLAYSVARRTKEMGIRIALGALPSRIIRNTMQQGMRAVVVGIILGLLATFWLSRFIEMLLFDISRHNPLVLAGAVAVFIVVAALAAWIPARRAAKIDPMEALRYE
jgi:putative ABC transport system permease protein